MKRKQEIKLVDGTSVSIGDETNTLAISSNPGGGFAIRVGGELIAFVKVFQVRGDKVKHCIFAPPETNIMRSGAARSVAIDTPASQPAEIGGAA